ncbi:hypothetical protein HN358_02370 [Candidatus Uhrbacteria bacterium]|jgi:hypothetical protein|nr:hypothetical protein [Candidatus Uhrbacteria bacterium]MBT7717524.1 hypothetical protein [Candidatus Uhrbacteria bacterium]
MKNMKTRSLALLLCNVSIIAMVLVPFTFMVHVPEAQAATITAYCDGTAASPVVPTDAPGGSELDEGSWTTSDNVTFLNGNNDGYCVLDKEIDVASVTIGNGLADGFDYAFLTHAAAGWDNDPTGGFDMQGVLISTSGNFTIYAGNGISADSKGCVGAGTYNGYGPNGSNVCTLGATGYGPGFNSTGKGVAGAGHGGAGGAGSSANGTGAYYGSNTAPILFGSSGGNVTSAALGGSGGGLVRLDVSGSFTHNGSITADGGDGGVVDVGDKAAGGGSGGSIYVTVVGAFAGSTGTFSADGGAGANDDAQDGGGGGGGRVSLNYGSSTFSGLGSEDFTVTGGTATGTAVAGDLGTVYVKDTTASAVTIYHGFTYDSDFSETTWTVDSSATGQYCDGASDATPSITVSGALTLAGTLDCTHASVTGFDTAAGTSVTLSSLTYTMNATAAGGVPRYLDNE